MSAEIIPFDEARRRVRRHRASTSDLVMIAAVCVWPLSWTVFVARAAVGVIVGAWGSRS